MHLFSPLNALLEVHHFDGAGYQPLVTFQTWRVALMTYSNDYLSDMIAQMQRHVETDEVFVLLQGRCILFLGEGDEKINQLFAEDMKPFQLYNVKKGTWHSHTFSPDAKVLIVENADTSPRNSQEITLSASQREKIILMTQQLWKE